MASGFMILGAFDFLASLAQTSTPVERPWYANSNAPIFLLVGGVIVMYFMMMRSKQRTEKDRQKLLNALKRGDRIQTIGGILGTVIEARETEVLIKVDESNNTKMRFVRSAIHRVLEDEKDKDKDKTESK